MPELPDVTVYTECLRDAFAGSRLEGVRLASPFLVRTFAPPLSALPGRFLVDVRRIGKRIALGFSADPAAAASYWCVIHLMVAGRLHKKPAHAAMPKKLGLLVFDFPRAALLLTEAGSKRRASVHVFASLQEAEALHRGGIEPLESSFEDFDAALRRENRTLKRALCDPRIISGIGNAYSDEILFWARLSPVLRTQSLSRDQSERLFVAVCHTLRAWIRRLRGQLQNGFLEKVTAFRPEMAVHGRFRQPCRECGTLIQRIAYAQNETDYCPRCQTEGKVLADRALSRLLRGDWPKRIEDLEDRWGTAAAENPV